MRWAANLRSELRAINQQIAAESKSLHEPTLGQVPSVIFGRAAEGHHHGNFYPTSFRNICANPQWIRRLRKVHTASRKSIAAGLTMDGA